ncbi:hypothetical protein KC865_00380 [Candidatus Kaiserbacteria bacterium]|nr:hypothetical protein [Candidatus Kaiserbacteria bacterium]USN92397.1 MAG: hypothetical protein H6782_01115 [Candidatus Nomurabacteria bacterium]
MVHGKVIIFLILSVVFAITHLVAVVASLYWYYWWFDILMHFWGGVLVGLGVHSICTFSRFNCPATLQMVVITLVVMTGAWEVFEYFAGLYEPATYLPDTIKDVIVGFSGGLLAHYILSKSTISS